MTADRTDDDRARFEAIAREVVDPVRRFLARRTDADTAADVLADTLLVCWRRLEEVPESAALPWAYAVARLALANAERGVRRQRRLAARISMVDPPPDAAPEEPAPEPDPRVRAVLDTLRFEDAELLRLWSWEQLGPSDLAAVLGISPNAASIRLHRARQKFKDAWRKIETTPGHEQPNEGRAR